MLVWKILKGVEKKKGKNKTNTTKFLDLYD